MTGETEAAVSSKKKNVVDLTIGSPVKGILTFTLPLVLGNVFQLFYSWTDAIILGNVMKSPEMFTALTASLPAVNLLITFINGFLAGASVVLGQMFGRGDHKRLKNAYTTLLVSITVLSAVVGVAGFFLSEPLLLLLQVDEMLLPYSAIYLKIYFAGVIFMALYNAFAQTLRSLGNSKMPLIALTVCVVLNIGMDCFFVIVLNMGIEGVAIATMIAQFVSVVIMFLYIQFRVPLLKFKLKELRIDNQLLKSILRLGIPSMIQNICVCLGFMVISAIINSHSAEFTTAFGLGNRIDEILTQINISFGVAISSYAAQNKGKGEILRIRKGYRITMLIMTVTTAVLAALVFIFRNDLLNLFVDLDVADSKIDLKQVLEIANVFLSIYLPSFILMGCMSTTTNLIRGTGAAKLAMSVNLFSLVIRIGSAFLLDLTGPYGVFYASPIGWAAGFIWALIIYLKGGWAKIPTVTPAATSTN